MITSAHEVWIRRLEQSTPLLDFERDALRTIPVKVRKIEPRTDIVRDGDRPTQCCMIIDGFCWRYKVTSAGNRQILSVHMPGEMPDLQSLHLTCMDHTLASITRAEVALVSHQSLRELTRRFPHLTDALWRSTLIDSAIFRQWLVGLGARTAYQRIAHLFCELSVRQAAGGEPAQSIVLPLTQNELGDALGLSAVHVNRSLRDLREAGLALFERGVVQILDYPGLKKAGDFDPGYLQLQFVDRA